MQCNTDADCLKCNPGDPDFHIACFKKAGPTKLGECELRGFFKGYGQPPVMAPLAPNVDLPARSAPLPLPPSPAPTPMAPSIRWISSGPTKFDYNDQPIVAACSDVTFKGKQLPALVKTHCIRVLHGAYTWPNDPRCSRATPRCIA